MSAKPQASAPSEVLVEDMSLYAERHQVEDMLEEYMRRYAFFFLKKKSLAEANNSLGLPQPVSQYFPFRSQFSLA